MYQSIFSIAMTLFFVANPIGNSPAIMAMIKNFPFERQRWILLREGILALLVALFFQFCGENFLDLIHVDNYAVALCGGVLLFIVAINMVFPSDETTNATALSQEPFLVPIATPLLAGPSLLTIIMLTASQLPSTLDMTLSILLAWAAILAVLVLVPYLQKFLGKRGLIVLEQLMGLFVSFVAIEMTISGIRLFMERT